MHVKENIQRHQSETSNQGQRNKEALIIDEIIKMQQLKGK